MEGLQVSRLPATRVRATSSSFSSCSASSLCGLNRRRDLFAASEGGARSRIDTWLVAAGLAQLGRVVSRKSRLTSRQKQWLHSRLSSVACFATGQDWTRRDQLLQIEDKMQQLWEEHKAYEIDAPEDASTSAEKYFVTFPFPYMNGKLHLGHAFSITKAEFAVRFQRLQGKRALFPFGFHCTGMPIAAAALKLKECIAQRQAGNNGEQESALQAKSAEVDSSGEEAPGVFKGKKSKAVAKSGGLDQYDIMLALGIAPDDIPKFTDPKYWLEFFPPLAVKDMKKFGAAVDWRRTFITTDLNPYFDAFVRWQFLKLKEKYLANGKRQTIFSITTQQPCADHDRSEGEGVNPQEYTLIKLRVKELPEDWTSVLGDGKVFLVAATLRPETMYGQTNCFVLPEGEYGFFRMRGGDIFVCSQRSALNMCYQDLAESSEDSQPVCLMTKTGADLVGLPLDAPLCQYPTIHVLPMFTISMQKGTGVVTSVPAEAPDDFACLTDWKKRSNWREQYGVKEEWCQPFDVVDILTFPDAEEDVPSAPAICEAMKIESHRDKDKLAAAKKDVYQKGFYSGVMKVGPYAGQKVIDVKAKIKQDLIDEGAAVPYFEPEAKVVARSGDECVVALCDQWYLKYSDEEWTSRVRKHVSENFEMFSEPAMNALTHAVGWLGDWACSRTFGLGTKLPWDEQWLIESLSDSTVYMAYYTVAHLLEGLEGEDKIEASDLTEDVFDYVFSISENPPENSGIFTEVLSKMKREFQYWYPVDLRCSGKDLIQNHLTMSLFNHAAVWPEERFWPKAFYCNGHIMVDSEKMSKSKGNFLTLEEAISSYSADATRIACADSGDGLQDANFSRESCGKTILRLTTLQAWAEDAVSSLPSMRTGDFTFLDDIFSNEITKSVVAAHEAYSGMLFSDALRCALYDMENLRSQYSILTNGDMHADVIKRLLDSQTIILSPIAPHFCENLWRNVLGNETLVVQEVWPTAEKEYNPFLSRQYALIQGTLRTFRLQLEKFKSPKKKKKGQQAQGPPPTPNKAIVFVAKSYKDWQVDVLKVLQTVELNAENEPVDKNFMGQVRAAENIKDLPKQVMKQVMPFASFVMKQEVKARGSEALELELPFDEAAMLCDLSDVIKAQLGVETLEVVSAAEEHPLGYDQQRDAAGPAKPQIVFLADQLESVTA
ncbi:Leucine--tRNA ligase, cytoplasmic [Symbiodinium microadriaticum]|uniref:leucine--tRNA ligase n=1 Tax=Symbiodinium microadriaticum TaxID=2951 RepID=A0A1Q9E9S4_SYMMI|nr:Leucine--tRNA ligase, cytoplasmic [Symbiodinium microadriaticum]